MNDLSFSTRVTRLHCALLLTCWLGSAAALAQNAPARVQSADYIVAVVNSEPVTNREVQNLRQRVLKERAAQGTPVNREEIQRDVLEQLILEKIMLQQAREAGIKIEDEAIDQAEMNIASNNRIGRDELRKKLAQDGTTPTLFREQLRNQLMITRVREREVEARVRVSEVEIEQYLREQLQSRAAQAPIELNLGMILIAVPENSTEAQVQALGERAADISRRARSGENFAQLAQTYSQANDRGANGGAMGLRPAQRYPDLFIQATHNLAEGMTSAPVRSAAGFHILKVIERRQGQAVLLVTQTRARHILLRPSAQLSQTQAIDRLNEIRQKITSGKADFAAVAREMSQDGSAPQGGDLGWATPGMFVPEFEQVMNRLGPGQVSEPLVSRFGVHLLEVTARRDAPISAAEQQNAARMALREKKLDEAYTNWVQDLRGRAYIEMREPPQ